MTVETYTVIKATRIGSEKKEIGDEVDLVMSQARPLQHGGFITFDKEAGAAIQKLVGKAIDISVDDSDEDTTSDTEENMNSQPSRSSFRVEEGD